MPEANHFASDGALWAVRAYGDLNEVIWQAAFTDETPSEFIAAFLADLIKSEPLDTEREDDDPCAARLGHVVRQDPVQELTAEGSDDALAGQRSRQKRTWTANT